MSAAKLWEPYTWDLGAPVTTHANVTAFDVSAEGEPSVYVRYFEKAVVLVNPGNRSAARATRLSGGVFEDRLTGETGLREVAMAGRSGRVLLRARG